MCKPSSRWSFALKSSSFLQQQLQRGNSTTSNSYSSTQNLISIPLTIHYSATQWALPYGTQYFSATAPVGACCYRTVLSSPVTWWEGETDTYEKKLCEWAWLWLATEQTRKWEEEYFSQCRLRRANLCSILVTCVQLVSSKELYALSEIIHL